MKKMTKRMSVLSLAAVMVLTGTGGENLVFGADSDEQNQITVTALTTGPSELISDYGENEFFQQLAEKTGVTIEFQHPVSGNETQEFDLMLASGEYTDIIMAMSNREGYKGGDDAAVEDGVYRDLTDYVEEYMPNYWNLIQTNDEVRRLAYSEEGRIVNLVSVEYNAVEKEVSAQPSFAGMAIRKDWLDELGLEVPVTYDDWTTVLRAFKEEKGCSQPLYMSPLGYWTLVDFAAGYGATNSVQVNDGVISYGPYTDAWKNYVTLLHQWYEEGLIGAEYVTNDVFAMDVSSAGTDECGAMFMVYTSVSTIEEMCGGEWVACQLPVVQEGEMAQSGANDGAVAALKYYISTNLSDEDLPQVLSMFDYLYSDEGALHQAYGMEGDTYTLDENGNPVFTDKILNNPDGLTVSQAIDIYLCPANLLLMKDWSREYVSISDEEWEMCQTWDKDGADIKVPTLTLNSEESEEYSSAYTDVETYVQEMTNKFIMGTADIEAEWDTYIETLETMGVEKVISAYQSAYDRYIEK